jgi:hypothetical protein
MKDILVHGTMGAAVGTAADAAIQGIVDHEYGTTFNTKELGESAGIGFLGGAAGAVLGLGAQKLLGDGFKNIPLGDLLAHDGLISHVGQGAVVGAGLAGLQDLINHTNENPGWGALAGGLGGAAGHGAHLLLHPKEDGGGGGGGDVDLGKLPDPDAPDPSGDEPNGEPKIGPATGPAKAATGPEPAPTVHTNGPRGSAGEQINVDVHGNPAENNPTETGSTQGDPTETGLTQGDPTETGPAQVDLTETGPAQGAPSRNGLVSQGPEISQGPDVLRGTGNEPEVANLGHGTPSDQVNNAPAPRSGLADQSPTGLPPSGRPASLTSDAPDPALAPPEHAAAPPGQNESAPQAPVHQQQEPLPAHQQSEPLPTHQQPGPNQATPPPGRAPIRNESDQGGLPGLNPTTPHTSEAPTNPADPAVTQHAADQPAVTQHAADQPAVTQHAADQPAANQHLANGTGRPAEPAPLVQHQRTSPPLVEAPQQAHQAPPPRADIADGQPRQQEGGSSGGLPGFGPEKAAAGLRSESEAQPGPHQDVIPSDIPPKSLEAEPEPLAQQRPAAPIQLDNPVRSSDHEAESNQALPSLETTKPPATRTAEAANEAEDADRELRDAMNHALLHTGDLGPVEELLRNRNSNRNSNRNDGAATPGTRPRPDPETTVAAPRPDERVAEGAADPNDVVLEEEATRAFSEGLRTGDFTRFLKVRSVQDMRQGAPAGATSETPVWMAETDKPGGPTDTGLQLSLAEAEASGNHALAETLRNIKIRRDDGGAKSPAGKGRSTGSSSSSSRRAKAAEASTSATKATSSSAKAKAKATTKAPAPAKPSRSRSPFRSSSSPSSSHQRSLSTGGPGAAQHRGASTSRPAHEPTAEDRQRAQDAIIQGAKPPEEEPISAGPLRELVKSMLPDTRGGKTPQGKSLDELLSDKAVTEAFTASPGEWHVSTGDQTTITIRRIALGAPHGGDEQQKVDVVSTAHDPDTTVSTASALKKDPLNPTKYLEVPTPWVTVKPQIEGMRNSSASQTSLTHTHSSSTSLTRSDALSDVHEHAVTYEVTVSRPAEHHLTIPGVHRTPAVDTQTVELPVKLAWPRQDPEAAARSISLSYPERKPGVEATAWAAKLEESAKEHKSVLAAQIVYSSELHDTVVRLAGEGNEAAAEDWLSSFDGLGEDAAKKLYGNESIEHTFGSGSSARTVEISRGKTDGFKQIDTADETVQTHESDELDAAATQSVTRSWGFALGVKSGAALSVATVGAKLASKHSSTDLRTANAGAGSDVTQQRNLRMRKAEASTALVVRLKGAAGKNPGSQLVPHATLLFHMHDRADSLKPGQSFAEPQNLRMDEAPDSAHAVRELDQADVQFFAGPALAKLPERVPDIHTESQKLEQLIRANPKQLIDGGGKDEQGNALPGDGVRHTLPNGLGTLVVRARTDRAAGHYLRPLEGIERDEVLKSSGGQQFSRDSDHSEALTGTADVTVGVAGISSELGGTYDHSRAAGSGIAWQDKQVWHSSTTWHKYEYPIDHFDVTLERDGKDPLVVHSYDRDPQVTGPVVKISVPEPRGIVLQREPGHVPGDETAWGALRPTAAAKPTGQLAKAPASFLKPMRGVQTEATNLLAKAAKSASKGLWGEGATERAMQAAQKLMQDPGFKEWSASKSDPVGFDKTVGPAQVPDQFRMQAGYKGHGNVRDHQVHFLVESHTELTNWHIERYEGDHEFNRTQQVSTDLSAQQGKTRGLEAGVTASPADATSILGLAGASAAAKLSAEHGTTDMSDHTTVEQTTQTYKHGSYVVVADAVYRLRAQVHFDDKAPAAFSSEKAMPGAVMRPVDAADLHDLNLSPQQVEKLVGDDAKYLYHRPSDAPVGSDSEQAVQRGRSLAAPAKEVENLGTVGPHRSGAVSEILDHVDRDIRAWASKALVGKDPELAQHYDELRSKIVRALGERLTGAAYNKTKTDMRNGGHSIVVTDDDPANGKRELRIVLHETLSNGEHFNSIDELTTSSTVVVTGEHKTEVSNTQTAEATAGAQGSTAPISALAHEVTPGFAADIDSVTSKVTAPLDNLPAFFKSQAESVLDKPKDWVDEKIAGKLSPAASAQAVHRTAVQQGGGEKRTVKMSRSGPAEQFVYNSHIRTEIQATAHGGYVEDAAKSLFMSDKDRRDVVNSEWRSDEHDVPDAERLTLHEEDYAASDPLAAHDPASAGPRARSQDSWKGLPDGSILIVKPFSGHATGKSLNKLIHPGAGGDHKDAGAQRGRNDDRGMNSFRAEQLLAPATATEAGHHYRAALSPSGSRHEVDSKSTSLKAVTIKRDIKVLKVDGPLPAGAADQKVEHSNQDHKDSSVKGSASAATSEDGPKIKAEGGRGGKDDTPQTVTTEQDARPLYRALVEHYSSVTPEYTPEHGSSWGRSRPAPKPAETYESDGHGYVYADAEALRALGVEPPAAPAQDHSAVVEVKSATPISQSPVSTSPDRISPRSTAPGSPTGSGRRPALESPAPAPARGRPAAAEPRTGPVLATPAPRPRKAGSAQAGSNTIVRMAHVVEPDAMNKEINDRLTASWREAVLDEDEMRTKQIAAVLKSRGVEVGDAAAVLREAEAEAAANERHLVNGEKVRGVDDTENGAAIRAEAEKIFTDLRRNYGVEVSSAAAAEGLDRSNGPRSVLASAPVKKRERAEWDIENLRAIEKAFSHFGNAHGVKYIGRLKAHTSNDHAFAQFLDHNKSIAFYDRLQDYESPEYVRDGGWPWKLVGWNAKPDHATTMEGAAIHEIAHSISTPEVVQDWVSRLRHWSDPYRTGGGSRVESPPTPYGHESEREDIAESFVIYFLNKDRMEVLFPERTEIIPAILQAAVRAAHADHDEAGSHASAEPQAQARVQDIRSESGSGSGGRRASDDALGGEIGRALQGADPDFRARVYTPDRAQHERLESAIARAGSGLRGGRVVHVERSSGGEVEPVGWSEAPWSRDAKVYAALIHHEGDGVFTVPLASGRHDGGGTRQSDEVEVGRGLARRPSLVDLGESATVVLGSCASGRVGAKGEASAQVVARESGRVVYAPTGDVLFSEHGFALTEDEDGHPGQWVKFYPDGRPSEVVTGELHHIGDARELPALDTGQHGPAQHTDTAQHQVAQHQVAQHQVAQHQVAQHQVAQHQPTWHPQDRFGAPDARDVRRYDQPGGYVRDEAASRAMRRNFPRHSNGRYRKHSDPRNWARYVNGSGPTKTGRAANCADCARSFITSWFGKPTAAMPRRYVPGSQLDGHNMPEADQPELQRQFTGGASHWDGPRAEQAYEVIAARLRAAGEGAAALIHISWPETDPVTGQPALNSRTGLPRVETGHLFNAVNYKGTIRWVDSQNDIVQDHPMYLDAVNVFSTTWDAHGDVYHEPYSSSSSDAESLVGSWHGSGLASRAVPARAVAASDPVSLPARETRPAVVPPSSASVRGLPGFESATHRSEPQAVGSESSSTRPAEPAAPVERAAPAEPAAPAARESEPAAPAKPAEPAAHESEPAAPAKPAAPAALESEPGGGRPVAGGVDDRHAVAAQAHQPPESAVVGKPHATPGSPHHGSASHQVPRPPDDPLGPPDVRDVRLYNKPGGYTRDSPAQNAMRANFPKKPDGSYVVHADPRLWLRFGNGAGMSVAGRINNCADCARAFITSWFGKPTAAMPRRVVPGSNLDERGKAETAVLATNDLFAGGFSKWEGWNADSAAQRVAQRLLAAGPGSASMVMVNWPVIDPVTGQWSTDPVTGAYLNQGAHQFNAVNFEGTILWVDMQSNVISLNPLYPTSAGMWSYTFNPNGDLV